MTPAKAGEMKGDLVPPHTRLILCSQPSPCRPVPDIQTCRRVAVTRGRSLDVLKSVPTRVQLWKLRLEEGRPAKGHTVS